MKNSFLKILPTLLFAFFVIAATKEDGPYDEKADAKVQIKQALTQAAETKIPVIIVFGANWCPDCLVLDKAMKTGASAPLLARDFKIVKVDVGNKDKNADVAGTYGIQLEKGIPAVAIISSSSEVLYVTKDGELSNARKMSDQGIYDFFKRVTAEATAKK
jgi:protein disulfide-isomerase